MEGNVLVDADRCGGEHEGTRAFVELISLHEERHELISTLVKWCR